jgi:hypothetical protein
MKLQTVSALDQRARHTGEESSGIRSDCPVPHNLRLQGRVAPPGRHAHRHPDHTRESLAGVEGEGCGGIVRSARDNLRAARAAVAYPRRDAWRIPRRLASARDTMS